MSPLEACDHWPWWGWGIFWLWTIIVSCTHQIVWQESSHVVLWVPRHFATVSLSKMPIIRIKWVNLWEDYTVVKSQLIVCLNKVDKIPGSQFLAQSFILGNYPSKTNDTLLPPPDNWVMGHCESPGISVHVSAHQGLIGANVGLSG